MNSYSNSITFHNLTYFGDENSLKVKVPKFDGKSIQELAFGVSDFQCTTDTL